MPERPLPDKLGEKPAGAGLVITIHPLVDPAGPGSYLTGAVRSAPVAIRKASHVRQHRPFPFWLGQ